MLIRVVLGLGEAKLRRRLRTLLPDKDVLPDVLRSGEHAWERLLRKSGDLFVVSRDLLPDPTIESLAALKALPESPDVLVLSDREDEEESARLIGGEAAAVISTEVGDDVLRNAVETVVERRRQRALSALSASTTDDRPRLGDFVTESPTMQSFLLTVQRLVANDSTLLITGETGVGKEHLARAIHNEGPRSEGPFVSINCGALPEALLESELFGHEEGAFTGANRTRRGRFELAHNGTIFLDEIGEMPIHLQVKLLHVLQTREVQRVGGDETIAVDVRVMAATNRDLEAELQAKTFRLDLYYRLSVVSLHIPALRDRKEDIAALAAGYITHFQRRFATAVDAIDPDALEAMKNYSWPGNVRELINIIERAMLLCAGTEIGLADLPQNVSLRTTLPVATAATVGDSLPLPERWPEMCLRDLRNLVVEQLEARYLDELLRATEGRVGETAELAGIQPRSLFEKMRRHGLRKESYRRSRRQGRAAQ